ncbi:hypothetical protein BDR26DRAFT_1002538 [Obelidium mucronatum]|nr:hypothetical protein BDR26DRAFT_1002538 [Obelidium mucronatum]
MESQLVSLPVSNAGNNLSPAGTSAWSPTLIFLVGFGATLCLLSAGIFCYSWYRNGRNHRRVCLSHMKAAASVGIEDVHNTTTLDIHSGKMDYDGQLYIPDEQDDEGCSDCVRDTVRHSMHSESSSTIKKSFSSWPMTALLTAAPTVIPPAAGTSSATDKAVVAAILLTVGLGLAVALGLVCVHVLKHRLSPQKQINDLESSIPSTFAKPSIEDLQNPARYQHRDPNIGQARLNKAHEDNSCTQSSEYQEEFFTDDSKSPTATIFLTTTMDEVSKHEIQSESTPAAFYIILALVLAAAACHFYYQQVQQKKAAALEIASRPVPEYKDDEPLPQYLV